MFFVHKAYLNQGSKKTFFMDKSRPYDLFTKSPRIKILLVNKLQLGESVII